MKIRFTQHVGEYKAGEVHDVPEADARMIIQVGSGHEVKPAKKPKPKPAAKKRQTRQSILHQQDTEEGNGD